MTSSAPYKPFISYDLETALSLKNRTAAALFSKLSYWFSKYEDGFYKFMEPCPHKLYRAGDSWTEEIGVARRTFTRAFDLIGVRYRSRRLFLLEEDPFQGKLFASYIDNDTNQTFYVKNPKALQEICHKLKTSPKSSPKGEGVKDQNDRRATVKMAVPYKDNKKDFKEVYPSKSPLPDSSSHEILEVKAKKDFKRKDPSSFFEENFKQAQEALDIFKTETQGRVPLPPLTPHFASKIMKTLEEHFGNCLKKWRLFCRLCASSQWLMGETKSTFKAWFIWLLKDKVIEAIRARRYGVKADLSLTPEVKISREDLEKKIENLPNVQEREARLKLLKRFEADVYRRDFDNMTLVCLEDGRFVLRFGAGSYERVTFEHKTALLEIFSSQTLETVPARTPIEDHLQRWKLEDATRYPYLFVTC